MMKRPLFAIAIMALSIGLASSCAQAPGRLVDTSQPSESQPIVLEADEAILKGRAVGNLTLQLKWPDSGRSVQAFPVSTKQFRLTVTAEDLSQPIVVTAQRPANATSVTLQLTVPAGSGRTLKVEGLNDSLKVVASATKADLSITPGEFTPVTMGLVNTVGDVAGTVVDQETGEAIPGAEVSLGSVVAVTDSAGNFALTDLDPGVQTLSIKKAGHNDSTHAVTIMAGITATAGTKGILRKHWTELASGTSERLLGLTVLSPTDLWIYGENLTLLHSTNGGVTWTRAIPTGVSGGTVYSVQFVNDTTGYVATENGLCRTTDGGATWNAVASGMPGRGLSVIDANTVIVYRPVGNNNISSAFSTDGGGTQSITDAGYGPNSSSDMPNFLTRGYSAFAWGDSHNQFIYKTTSGGSAWGTVDISPLRIPYRANRGIYPVDNNECYLAGYRDDGGVFRKAIGRSMSGGADWGVDFTSSATTSSAVSFRGMTKVGTTLCAVGEAGSIAMKYPGATTWTEMSVQSERPDLVNLNAVGFADARTGWAVGDGGKLVRY